jgi:hypothetical protein
MIEVDKVVTINAGIHYYIKGTDLLHKEDGPAVQWEHGMKEWWINGKRHRGDGPAIEFPNGDEMWALEGRYYSKEGWFNALSKENQMKILYSEYFIRGQYD